MPGCYASMRMNGAGAADVGLPRPGEVIAAKYRIESVVGTGGMGVVMGATDVSLGRPVAIKFLSPQKLSREGARERFLREARAAAQIQSEHVARVYEVGETSLGAPFIVMEHLRGADLSDVLRARGGLGIDEAVDYVLQACEALGEAHARGIVHRDLKPQNLFLTQRPDGSPFIKVLDFGISKSATDTAQSLTATDMVMGTPLYMSPEQVRSLKNVDQRADVWALGSILFELLTASPVFDAPSMSALCAMIATDPPIPLRARRPQAPPELEAVILRCLQKDPMGRFQDVAALADALAPFASPRGRDSAMRVSHVVRQGAPHVALAGSVPPHAGAMMASTSGTTMSSDGRGPGPAFAPTVDTGRRSQMPLGHVGPPTTQQVWNHPSQQPPQMAPRSGGGAAIVIVLGILTGLLLVGGAGAFLWYRADRDATSPVASAQAVATAAPSATVAPTTSATATSTATSASTDNKPGGAKTATPVVKDAGAPQTSKDAGAKPNDDAEQKKRLAQMAQERCDNHVRDMTTFARTDADRKRAAERAKTFTCLKGPTASSCERQVCMQACGILNDEPCLRQMKYVIDQGPKPPY